MSVKRILTAVAVIAVGVVVFAHHTSRPIEEPIAIGQKLSLEPPTTFVTPMHNWMRRRIGVPMERRIHAFLERFSANAGQRSEMPATAIKIVDRPIEFGDERVKLTLEYRRQHQDPNAQDINIHPRMIILHWTAIDSFDSTWKYFNNVRAEAGRTQLAAAGEVNVSAQFLVDRDGTIYRLMPETRMARHCIGLNHIAIGIENVGDGDKNPLTDAQVEADAKLVRYLAGKYIVEYLIGHSEYRRMEKSPLFLELDPKYRNTKPDPGDEFMKRVREKVSDLKLKGPE